MTLSDFSYYLTLAFFFGTVFGMGAISAGYLFFLGCFWFSRAADEAADRSVGASPRRVREPAPIRVNGLASPTLREWQEREAG